MSRAEGLHRTKPALSSYQRVMVEQDNIRYEKKQATNNKQQAQGRQRWEKGHCLTTTVQYGTIELRAERGVGIRELAKAHP